jgi:hypothetical protein
MYYSVGKYTVESNKNASSLSQHFEVAFSFAIFWKSMGWAMGQRGGSIASRCVGKRFFCLLFAVLHS